MRLQCEEGVRFPSLEEGTAVGLGIKGMADAFGVKLNKPKSISRSNWEQRPLAVQQRQYAAQDAYVGCWLTHSLHALHGTALPVGEWLQQQSEEVEVFKAARRAERDRLRSAGKSLKRKQGEGCPSPCASSSSRWHGGACPQSLGRRGCRRLGGSSLGRRGSRRLGGSEKARITCA